MDIRIKDDYSPTRLRELNKLKVKLHFRNSVKLAVAGLIAGCGTVSFEMILSGSSFEDINYTLSIGISLIMMSFVIFYQNYEYKEEYKRKLNHFAKKNSQSPDKSWKRITDEILEIGDFDFYQRYNTVCDSKCATISLHSYWHFESTTALTIVTMKLCQAHFI